MAKRMITPLHPARQWTMPPSPSHVLRLSSASFLDGVITLDGAPAYAVDTADQLTSIARCTPAGLHEVAQVHWPQHASKRLGTFVQLGQCVHEPEHVFLRRSAFSTSRKFRWGKHAFKWRHVPTRGTFECSTSADGRPVAVYEPAVLTAAARIKLYEPFAHDRPLVDVLVLTALLITCPQDEWRSVPAPFTAPRQPGQLPRYSLLADEFDLPARRQSKLERERSLRRVRSFAPSSSSSSTFSSAPSSPRMPRSFLSLDTSMASTSSASSPVSSVDDPPAWSSRFAPHKPPAPADAPPPYEHHQWTVRVPARAYTTKH